MHEHENFRARVVNSAARLMIKLDADIGMRGKKLYSRQLCVAGLNFFQPEHPYCHQIWTLNSVLSRRRRDVA